MAKSLEAAYAIEPSVIAGDWLQLEKQISNYISMGVKRFHLDVMDGQFVPNLTMGPDIVKSIRSMIDEDVILDVHLMIYEPYNHIQAFADAGADEITFHVESTEDIQETIAEIVVRGCAVGLAFKPETCIGVYEKYFCNEQLPIHKALIMTVPPGFGGQVFMEEQLERILTLSTFISKNELSLIIQVDGGINADTMRLTKHAGAKLFVTGSGLYRNQNPQEIQQAYEQLNRVYNS